MPVKIPVLDLYWHWLRCKSLPVVTRFGYVKAEQLQFNKHKHQNKYRFTPAHIARSKPVFLMRNYATI